MQIKRPYSTSCLMAIVMLALTVAILDIHSLDEMCHEICFVTMSTSVTGLYQKRDKYSFV